MLNTRLNTLKQTDPKSILSAIRRGVEKENLRVDSTGKISQSPHPKSLGAALTNPWVTTDFAECLIEMITPPENSIDKTYNDLLAVNQFILNGIDKEFLWPSSMPCELDAEKIPLADYGKTNVARMKKIYRKGLCYRYGRAMQVISGIHYNFSLPDSFFKALKASEKNEDELQTYINKKYLSMVRNFFRNAWLLVYLFGASPICADSSVIESVDYLKDFDKHTKISPYATSLRLSDLGYQNRDDGLLNISYNAIDEYASNLLKATQTPYEEFTRIGVRDSDGYKQLNDSILQIENEYYSPIRPKRVAKSCERPADALLNRGVEYVEVRLLDLDPLLPLSINKEQMAFVEVFLMYCMLEDSNPFEDGELLMHKENIKHVAIAGRKKGLQLMADNQEKPFYDLALDLFDKFSDVAELMGMSDPAYQLAVSSQLKKIKHVDLTPSQQVLTLFEEVHTSFQEFNMKLASDHKRIILSAIDSVRQDQFESIAHSSLEQFMELEQQPQDPFDVFLDRYFSA